MKRRPTSKINELQACITSVSFPSTLDELNEMVKIPGSNKYELTNMEELLYHKQYRIGPGDMSWSAPKWLVKGDILFFYHTKSAEKRAQSLLKRVQKSRNAKLIDILEKSVAIGQKYGETIFACATIFSSPEYSDYDRQASHNKGRIFADIANIHIFENPINASLFNQFVKISQGTITTLDKKAFDGLKQLLAAQNKLPVYLHQAEFSAVSFRNMSKDNWLSVITGKNVRFIHETQIREYFIDYLLHEIKDTRTSLLEECRCFRSGQKTGIVDYFVKVHGRWIPVEAKLNIGSERNILAQIKQYIGVDSFTPTKGTSQGKPFEANKSKICLVIDSGGLYLTHQGQFLKCAVGAPVYKREALTRRSISEIRGLLTNYV